MVNVVNGVNVSHRRSLAAAARVEPPAVVAEKPATHSVSLLRTVWFHKVPRFSCFLGGSTDTTFGKKRSLHLLLFGIDRRLTFIVYAGPLHLLSLLGMDRLLTFMIYSDDILDAGVEVKRPG